MTERAYQTVRISDIRNAHGTSLLRAHLDVRSFGINAFSAEAGAQLLSNHDEVESGHEEVYVVLSGTATFTIAGEEFDAPAGTVVHVPGTATLRGAVARDPGTTVLAVGGLPGQAFTPKAWESNGAVLERFEAGDYAGAKQLLLEACERYGAVDLLEYNLACAEARLGDTDAALEHLERSIEQRPAFAEHARTDPDLEAIRGHERFAKLVGEA